MFNCLDDVAWSEFAQTSPGHQERLAQYGHGPFRVKAVDYLHSRVYVFVPSGAAEGFPENYFIRKPSET